MQKIARKTAYAKCPKFPHSDNKSETFYFPKSYKDGALIVGAKTPIAYSKELSVAFSKLITNLGIENLVFLGDTKTPWLNQENDYKPVKEALQYLKDSNVGGRFNGALKIEAIDLEKFMRHLFWLSRCNATLPEFYFMDEKQNILGTVCKYGFVHISILNKKTDENFKKALKASGFKYLQDTKCYDLFGKTGATKNRQTKA